MLEAKGFLQPGGAVVNPQGLRAKDILPDYVVRGTLPGFADRFDALLEYFQEGIKFNRKVEYPEVWMDHYAAVGEALERCKFHDALLRLVKILTKDLKADVPRHGWTPRNKERADLLHWAITNLPIADECGELIRDYEQIGKLEKDSKLMHSLWAWLLGDA